MDEPLTPDEEAVMGELLRLDLEPNDIPPPLFEGFLQKVADSADLPLPRARAALQGLIDKGKFDTGAETDEEPAPGQRDLLRDLLLHDPEVQVMLRKVIADILAEKVLLDTRRPD